MNALHDMVQLLVYLLASPRDTHGVLCHLQTTGSHTASIHSLAWGKQLTGSNELVNSLGRAAHVRHLGHA